MFIKRVIFFILFVIFFLSSLGFIHFFNYNLVGDYFGLSDKSIVSNAKYVGLIGGIAIFVYIINFIISLFISKFKSQTAKEILNFRNQTDSLFQKIIYEMRNNGSKMTFGMLLGLVFLAIFLKIGIFQCYWVVINGGRAEYCGTKEQITFLIVSMVCLMYSLLPENIVEK
jgi:hypothetical protein